MKQIVPSLLAADFSKLESEIRSVEKAGAERLHLDIMDGHFVPNITFGPMIVEAVNKLTDLHLQTHLMIEEPKKYLENFIEAGSDTVMFQVEIEENISERLQQIKSYGVKAGLVINPSTNFEKVEPYLTEIDHLLVMTVEPGFGGQNLIESTLDKVRRSWKYKENNEFFIEIDGGVNLSTISKADDAGTELFVAGSAVYGDGSPEEDFIHLSKRLSE